MPSSYKYGVVTANCGNDSIGEKASSKIVKAMKERDADFYVINCQETDFNKTRLHLEQQIKAQGGGYEVRCLGQMTTHTKPDTQFHNNTGVATFIICKKDITLGDIKVEEARREKSRFSGSGYNKGGLITEFTVTQPGKDQLKVQAVSGHLDSNDIVKRNQDWHLLHRKIAKQVTNWDELVAACPNLLLSGYDANTRNKWNEKTAQETDMWENPDVYPEIQALHRASLADAHFSREHTYDHTKEGSLRDSKRPDYTGRGRLDFAGVAGGHVRKRSIDIDKGSVQRVKPEEGSERDHSVIISPSQDYESMSAFEVVKNQMASRLRGVAPQLAEKIEKMVECDDEDAKLESHAKLVKIYQDYLIPHGLLSEAIRLHIKKLECLERVEQSSFFKNTQLGVELSTILFGQVEWCDGEPEKVKAKQGLMDDLLNSLAHCNHESGIDARLECYRQLEKKIDGGESINATAAFKELAAQEYIKLYESFKKALELPIEEDNPKRKMLNEMGQNVLKHLDAIANCSTTEKIRSLDPKSLDKLTRIVEHCSNAYNTDPIDPEKDVTAELNHLSQEAMGSSSPLWRALASALDIFVRVASLIAETNIGIVHDKRLSDSIEQYKTALKGADSNSDENGVDSVSTNADKEDPEYIATI